MPLCPTNNKIYAKHERIKLLLSIRKFSYKIKHKIKLTEWNWYTRIFMCDTNGKYGTVENIGAYKPSPQRTAIHNKFLCCEIFFLIASTFYWLFHTELFFLALKIGEFIATSILNVFLVFDHYFYLYFCTKSHLSGEFTFTVSENLLMHISVAIK